MTSRLFAAMEREMFLVSFSMFFFLVGASAETCSRRNYGSSSFVCVCNVSSCDSLDPVSTPPQGTALVYESVRAKSVFSLSSLKFSSSPASGNLIAAVNESTKYQFIVGFGGAFTDAAGINIASLPPTLQKDLIKAYYSRTGLEYSMGRVPMASCDFSTHVYSYDDTPGDFNLTHFQLAEEDLKYKIPYIRLAQQLCEHELLLFGSPWSAPAWMKTSQKMYGKGSLIGKPGGQYYQAWANYFVKFLQAYEKFNISFWGLTVENEPTSGNIAKYPFQAMGFTPEMERDFIKLNLGPTLAKAGYGIEKIKLMIMDDQRFLLPKWADVVLEDANAAKYVSGIAFHWYYNEISPAKLLDVTHGHHPNMFFLPSEACTGFHPWETVELGSWDRAEQYAHDIIQDLLYWSIGWMDWNLALNEKGGPNWVGNFADAPIIVNATAQEFYKQPMYYALAHFSKLLPPGSIHIGLDIENIVQLENLKLDLAAFITPSDQIVVIAVNREDTAIPLSIRDMKFGYLNSVTPPHSIQSYVWSSH